MRVKKQEIDSKIPKYVWWVSERLAKAGHEAYLVGGSVRDLVIGRPPKDFDLATNAKPDEVQRLFPDSIAIGAAFGIITVLAPDEKGEVFQVEVATYRTEEDYTDGRWPTKVEFTTDISRDLGRRDFTINAMAYPLHLPENERELLDPFDGVGDIERKIIRAVGTPIERFKEDGLRGFRACRLASVLGYAIEPETMKAIKDTVEIAEKVSVERMREEFLKILYQSSTPSVGIELMREGGLLRIFLPELLEGIGIKQSKRHVNNVYEHILRTVDKAIDEVKLAALFHDIGKPRCATADGHFYGHEVVGARMAKEIMRRMKFSNEEIDRVQKLVKRHMFWYQEEWTDSAVRRLIRSIGGEEMIEPMLALRMADSQSDRDTEFKPWVVEALQKRIAKLREQEMALKVTDLALNGQDVIKLGVPEGYNVRVILDYLLDLVVDEPGMNTRENLEKEVKKFIAHDFALLQLVNEKDEPVGKGYLDDPKLREGKVAYRKVEFTVAAGGGRDKEENRKDEQNTEKAKKQEKVVKLKKVYGGTVLPDEPYEKALRRLVREQLQLRIESGDVRDLGKTKTQDTQGNVALVQKYEVVESLFKRK